MNWNKNNNDNGNPWGSGGNSPWGGGSNNKDFEDIAYFEPFYLKDFLIR